MNSDNNNTIHEKNLLEKAGLAAGDANAWLVALPELRNNFSVDGRACSNFWELGRRLRAQLPKKPARDPNHTAANEVLHRKERELRERFLSLHVEELYGTLT